MLKFLNLPKRALNLQEYHSKNLLAKYNCTIQPFYTANTPEQAKTNSTKLLENGASEIVLKAQILAGGRGKGHFLPNGFKGGVKLSTDVDEIENLAGKMLGQRLVTKQTNKEGVLVDTVMVAHALNIERELYLAILMDRESNGPVVIASPAGGMDIEKVAEETPDKILQCIVDPLAGIQPYQCRDFGFKLGLNGKQIKQFAPRIDNKREDACEPSVIVTEKFVST